MQTRDKGPTATTVGDDMSTESTRITDSPGRSADTLSDLTLPSDQSRRTSVAPALWRRHRPWMTEIGLVFGMYWLYSVMRSASPDRVAVAASTRPDAFPLEHIMTGD